jgi:hypothetical protein
MLPELSFVHLLKSTQHHGSCMNKITAAPACRKRQQVITNNRVYSFINIYPARIQCAFQRAFHFIRAEQRIHCSLQYT